MLILGKKARHGGGRWPHVFQDVVNVLGGLDLTCWFL